MARALRGVAGEILSLAALLDEHPQAIKSDLIDRGLRLRDLGTDALTWDDLAAVVDTLKLRPESALYRTVVPDWMWGLPEMLLADTVDSLRWLVWAKTPDGQRNRRRPKPVPRPGVRPERIGDAPVSIADMNEFLGWEV
ncbi:hypothetical protein IU487_22425 [Nocardia puris]|uniref:DUF5361 domain-containing protein n=1 Tax=Nocardia puris TaxID=208602 RepID=UPI0018931228|nr:DUF5361 domain-containing protein [Nocardia puris]MBF6213777.1 hypothetical protein [Nocardia puris]